MLRMQCPITGLESQTACLCGEDDRSRCFGKEEHVRGEDNAAEDDHDVFGPSPSQIRFRHGRSDDGCNGRATNDAK